MTLREYMIGKIGQNGEWLLYGDVGYGVIRQDNPRNINCGIAEQAMIGMAMGMCEAGETVNCFCISPHYLRAWEFIRNLKEPNYNFRILGAGANYDYSYLGHTHQISSYDMQLLCDGIHLPYYFPQTTSDVDNIMSKRGPMCVQIPNKTL